MGRRKSASNVTIKPWLSARRDNKEGRFIQVGSSFLLDKSCVQELNASAFKLYLCMCLESGGSREFKFSHGVAKKYGIKHATFDNSVKELQAAGFIERVYDSDFSQYKTAVYRFTLRWKGIVETAPKK